MGMTLLCPRCGVHRFTPRDVSVADVGEEHINTYPWPALSRVTRVDICTPCGQDEAMRDFQQLPPIPPDQWPVALP